MAEISFGVLAFACSIASLAISLVVAIRSTPQRVRQTANSALELAEEMRNGFQVVSQRMVSFMEEVTRERTSAAGDLEEAERKRRQAAAKLSKVESKTGAPEQPQTLREVLATLPPGDPRRLQILRRANMTASQGE